MAAAEFDAANMQDLGDVIPALLEIKARLNVPLEFHVKMLVGDGESKPDTEAIAAINKALEDVQDTFRVS